MTISSGGVHTSLHNTFKVRKTKSVKNCAFPSKHMANPSKYVKQYLLSVKIRPIKFLYLRIGIPGYIALIRQNPSKSVTCMYVHVFGFAYAGIRP